MIKTPSELFQRNTDNEILPTTFYPPPTSFLAQYEQVSTAFSHVQDDFHKKENEIMNYYKLLRDIIYQCEMLAYDFTVFLDESRQDQIHEFFYRCFAVNEDSYTIDFNNLKSIFGHIKDLLTFINNLNNIFMSQPHLDPTSCLGNPKHQEFLEQLKEFLKQSSQIFSESSPICVDSIKVSTDFQIKTDTDSQEFANFLVSQYPSSPSLEIQQLANRLAFRLTTIFDLQESITKMRELYSTSETSRETEIYDIKSIINSGKYKLLNERHKFFSAIMKYINLDTISTIAQQLTYDLKNEMTKYDSMSSNGFDVYMSEVQNFSKWVENNKIAVDQEKSTLPPLASQFFQIYTEHWDQLESRYNDFAIQETISKFRKKYLDQQFLRKIDEVHLLYHKISRVFDEGAKIAYRIRDLEFQIIDANSKNICSEDMNELYQRSKDADAVLSRLEYFLKSIKDSNAEFRETTKKIKRIRERIETIENNLFDAFEKFNQSLKGEVKSYPLQTEYTKTKDSLIQEIRKRDADLALSRKILYDIKEEKASLGKWSELFSNDIFADDVNSAYQSNFEQMEKLAICPVCNSNYRNVVFEECGHVVCLSCFEESKNKKNFVCPVCKKPCKMNEFDFLEKPVFFSSVLQSKEAK